MSAYFTLVRRAFLWACCGLTLLGCGLHAGEPTVPPLTAAQRDAQEVFVLLAAELWRCSAFLLSLREQRSALRAHALKGGKSVLLGTTAWRDELKK